MYMRPPAIPLLTIDPYFSVWAEESVLKNTVHWTGKPNTISGRVFVDGVEYHFLGYNEYTNQQGSKTPTMTVEEIQIDAYSTNITYSNEMIRLFVRFTSPLLVDDLYYVSRPVSYCKVSYESIDKHLHSVEVKFTVSEELVLSARGEGRALADTVNIPGMTAMKMGNGVQDILKHSGDEICIDWGYLYLAVVGHGKAYHTVLDGMYAMSMQAMLQDELLFLFAYDDIKSIQYFGENLNAYWKKDNKTIEEAMSEAAQEYGPLIARCNAFSEKIKIEATEKGGEKYAELLLLSLRQIMGGHKLVVDSNGQILYISKECSSGGFAATVDVTYPSAPLFLLYNPELLKGMLRPVMQYANTDEWIFDFAPHDVGMYPLLNGQEYGVERAPDGSRKMNPDGHMPVEECGNMLILFAAICDADNSTDFVAPYMDTIKRWSDYLIKYGLDPENQLCTDDFAGHLAHNVNLSIKAIMGITGYSRILERMGEISEANRLMRIAKEYAASVVERAANPDGSLRLAYDKPDTFSLKYNAVWDKIWNTGLFPAHFFTGEIARYKKEMLCYGVPLDSREKYTKSDWTIWVATFCDNIKDFSLFADTLWATYNTMRTWAPMPDWYYCDTSNMQIFHNRTVQGGLFIRLMMK